jgi:CHASE3 domain sensor protein
LILAWSVIGITIGTHQMQAKLSDVVQTRDAVITNIYEGIKLRDDQETGLRGYLLTGQKAFLRPYTQAAVGLPHLRSESVKLTSGMDRRVSSALKGMFLAGKAWDRWAEVALAHPPANARTPAAIAVLLRGKHLFDQFRSASASTVRLAERARTSDVNASQKLADMTTWFLVI